MAGNINNLKPIKTKERAKELGAKGGRVKSMNKKVAARLRELRKKGMTDETAKHLVSMLEDPGYSSMDILISISKMKSDVALQIKKKKLTKKEEWAVSSNLVKSVMDWHKLSHGDKKNIELESKGTQIHSVRWLTDDEEIPNEDDD